MRDRAEDARRVCNEIIDRICARGECDLVWDIAARLRLILIANDLGVEPEDRDQLLGARLAPRDLGRRVPAADR